MNTAGFEAEEEIRKRLKELADRSYNKGQYTFTPFLGLSELSVFRYDENNLRYASPSAYGGYDDAERMVVRFGDKDELGYEERFPIDVLEISPLAEKFADDLSHRDFLGALMSLGIERNLLGDIIVSGKKAYLFCLDRISDYIIENLISVRHTSVSVSHGDTKSVSELKRSELKEKVIQVASPRCDAVIAKFYNMSRNDASECFRQGKVFINGRLTESTSVNLKDKDAVTVRGYGRFTIARTGELTKKGKINLLIEY